MYYILINADGQYSGELENHAPTLYESVDIARRTAQQIRMFNHAWPYTFIAPCGIKVGNPITEARL